MITCLVMVLGLPFSGLRPDGDDVLAANGGSVKLPTIARLVLAAPPQLGAPFVWNLWNGNFNSFRDATRGADIFQGYSRTYKFVRKGGVIPGPAGNISKADLRGRGLAEQVSFLRAYNPLFRLVLPTTAFLYTAATPGRDPISINETADRNELLLDLNAGSTPGNNPWVGLANETSATYPVHVLAKPSEPDSVAVLTDVMDQTHKGTGGEILPFTEFGKRTKTSTPTTPDQTWYSEVYESDAGDGAFPTQTMQSMFYSDTDQPDPGVTLQQWGNGASAQPSGKDSWVPEDGDLSHNLFIENPAIVNWIAAQAAP